MRTRSGKESTNTGRHATRNDGVHSLDGGGSSNGSSTKTQDVGIGTESSGRKGADDVSETTWFAPVEEEEISDCPGGICPVPWAVAKEELAPGTTESVEISVDNVNHPSHYMEGGIECIEAIEASLTTEEYRGFLKGNIQKYVWRERQKGGVESLQKAQWYLERLIQLDN